MILGIGNDIIEVERVVNACKRQAFLKKVFTENEKSLIEKDIKKAAGSFAVKEAVSKVFGTGFSGCGPKDIEVLRDKLGKPYVVLHGAALKKAGELGIENIFVSISNTKKYAAAVAVGEGSTR